MPEQPERRVRAYFGHHKCASTWIMEILSRVSVEAGIRHLLVVDDLTPQGIGPLRDRATLSDVQNVFDRTSLREHVDQSAAELVSCLTADRDQAEVLQPYRGFHVIRDPRDIIVSAYFSHRNSHPTDTVPHLAAHRAALREVPKSEGLFLEMEYSGNELRQLEAWNYTDERILELKMEDLTRDPFRGFILIFKHLELLAADEPVIAREQAAMWMSRLGNRLALRLGRGRIRRRTGVTGDLLLGTVYAKRFEAQSGGRTLGSEDASSHYRKGVPGDWRRHFTPEHSEAFDQRFGRILIKLGYEEDHAWMTRDNVMSATT